MPTVLRLEDEAPVLRDLPLVDVEMPGVYCVLYGGGEPPPGLLGQGVGANACGGPNAGTPGDPGAVLLEALGSTVAIVRRHGANYRRVAMHGSDGRTRHMVIQQSQNYLQSSMEDRVLQLLRSLNRLLDAHPQSRARALGWYVPAIVPVHPSVRLMEEDPSFASYYEAYDINCTRYGREADIPIVHFKKRCSQVTMLWIFTWGMHGSKMLVQVRHSPSCASRCAARRFGTYYSTVHKMTTVLT